jgi:hypothetical protein
MHGNVQYVDDEDGRRTFSPEFFTETWEDKNVKTVVRLGCARYDSSLFEAHCGIRHIDLPLQTAEIPAASAVAEFLRIVDAAARAGQAVAVHSDRPEQHDGRTGVLAALWLMISRGFSARTALGWLLLMQPNAVNAAQGHMLLRVGDSVEAHLRSEPAPAANPSPEKALAHVG